MGTFCRATLNYLGRTGDPDAGLVQAEVDIRDGRVADLPGWQECGFELVGHESKVQDWSDDAEIHSVHHAEIEALAREMTGAEVALVSGHIKRSPEKAKEHEQLAPIRFVHSDFAATHDQIIRRSYDDPSPGGRAALARNGVDASAVQAAGRVVILQFWRNLGPAKMDYPLAFCDIRTVTPEQGRALHVTNYAGTGFDFDALVIAAPAKGAAHAWYAFPELRPNEAVAFRTYDTDLVRAGKVFFTPHSAFHDPEVPPGQPARSSIELRATCLFS